ncbi:MAG TPA: GAF domain-containing protein, partial [Polyangiaceae bacterium]
MKKPRILVVEDETIVARDIRLQLVELGYEPVGHATQGEEAVALAGRLRPDLVLMDIRLAGATDGIAAARAIRTQLALPVVFLTAFAEDETLERAKLTEPFGYILKPFSERELRTVLSMALYKNRTEAKLRRVSQLYAALTACNQAIVRSKNEAELFPQICRDAVTFGGMKMAWIGLVQEASGEVKPVASFGDGDGYLADIRITVDAADPLGVGPTGTAVREGRPYWCQDFVADPRTAAWHERGARAGWASSATLPLRRGDVVVGGLTVYAAEAYAFDDDIRKLLLEMADDISFALESYRMRQALATAVELLERTSEMAKVGGWEVELRTGQLFWSKEACRIHEVDPSEAPSTEEADRYCAPEARPLIHAAVSAAAEKGTPWDLELPALTAKGRAIWVRSQGSVVTEHGKAIKLVGAFQDITERKHAEEEKLRLEAQLQHAMKLESVGRLAGGVAHDFNNMLGVILANAEFAMD